MRRTQVNWVGAAMRSCQAPLIAPILVMPTLNTKEIPMDEQSPHDGSGVTRTATEARQGETTGRLRWMLRISVALVVIGMGVAYLVS